MSEPLLDDDGYPSEEELRTIREWSNSDIPGLLEYMRERWRWAEDGYWKRDTNSLYASTGGWSGNEDLMAALQGNHVVWMLIWQQSTRGGHYTFDLTILNRLAVEKH